jgi:hypothetical protein
MHVAAMSGVAAEPEIGPPAGHVYQGGMHVSAMHVGGMSGLGTEREVGPPTAPGHMYPGDVYFFSPNSYVVCLPRAGKQHRQLQVSLVS